MKRANANNNSSSAIGQTALSLPALVAAQMLQSILDGTLAPGAHLREIELAEQHAVSRATIREALTQLERQRFVERVPRYGARVAAVDNDEVLEIYQLRAVIFGLACRLACQKATAEELRAFEAAVREMEALAARTSTGAKAYMEHSIAAQQMLIGLSHSRRTGEMYEQLTSLTLWLGMIRQTGLGFATPKRRKDSAADWRRMADAMTRRDAVASEAAAVALMTASGQYVWAQLQKAARPA
ncbi:MAG TPA: GntR family transcriptional regulator [Burkholderiales bacterium]|jgi:DNA-binding GntR family transcriptional regulator